MEIKWFGHSCFLLTGESGVKILMDPMGPGTGYQLDPVEADAVTASHAHSDHNYFEIATGNPLKIVDEGPYSVKDAIITGVPTYHDSVLGAKRGSNMIYVVEIEGMRIVHLGDLGHVLDEETIAKLSPVDVLLVPIGGYYTISAAQALEVANQLKPNVLIPMHYRTIDCVNKELSGLMPFLNAARNCSIHRLRQSEATLTKDSLGSDRLIALFYDRKEQQDAV